MITFLTWLKDLSTVKKIVLIAVLVLLITGIGASAWYNRISNLDRMFPNLAVEFPGNTDVEPEMVDIRGGGFADKVLNILLMGFDRDESRLDRYVVYRPDTIMLASINLDMGKVDVLSIPRDTLVPIYNLGGSKDKINSAYTYGWKYGGAPQDNQEEKHRLGMEYQVKTVTMALKGIPIHYYMTIDMDGVVEVVETLGGVWYDVEKRMYDKKGRIVVEPGYQLLNGKTFLGYVRNRNYSSGDLQRVKNQQNILLAAFEQFKNAGTLLHAPQIYSSLRDRIETNLTLEQIMSLALFANQKVDSGSFETHILDTSYANGRLHESWESSYSYLIINQKKRSQLLSEIWGLEVAPDATDVILPPLPEEEPGLNDDSDSPLLPVDGEGGSPVPQEEEPGRPGDQDLEQPIEGSPGEPVDEATS